MKKTFSVIRQVPLATLFLEGSHLNFSSQTKFVKCKQVRIINSTQYVPGSYISNTCLFSLFLGQSYQKTIIICCALGENNLKKKVHKYTPNIFKIHFQDAHGVPKYLVLVYLRIHIQQLCNSIGAQIKFNTQGISLQSEQSSNSFLFLLIMWVMPFMPNLPVFFFKSYCTLPKPWSTMQKSFVPQ